MGTVHPIVGSCVVCKTTDARALSTTRLVKGEVVIVCGTHELIHRRAGGRASTITELRTLVSDRRDPSERRASGDELADALTTAFGAGERRRTERRT